MGTRPYVRPWRDLGSVPAAQQASVLFLAAGMMTVANNHIPGGTHRLVNDVVGVAALLVVPFGWILPWGRWSDRATLAYFPFCLALLVINGVYGNTPSQIYGVWFVVAFVWVGLHHPPRTSLALAAPAAAAYLLPLIRVTHPSGDAIRSVVIAIPAAALIGEILSATTYALHEARSAQDRANKLLADAAVTDDLTGLGNRRFVNTLVDTLEAGDVLLLLDLDHFKEINDTRGHQVGDGVLAELGAYLSASTRGNGDAAARYGGEEFLVVLRKPVTAPEAVADRLLQGWRDRNPLATFSLGGSHHVAGRSPWDTLKAADNALYDAKANGRDRFRLSCAR